MKAATPEVKLAVAEALFAWLAGGCGCPEGLPKMGQTRGDAPATCCDTLCAGVPAGKKRLLICDGTTVTALAGTADGQYPAWDATANTWVLANA